MGGLWKHVRLVNMLWRFATLNPKSILCSISDAIHYSVIRTSVLFYLARHFIFDV